MKEEYSNENMQMLLDAYMILDIVPEEYGNHNMDAAKRLIKKAIEGLESEGFH